jgi:glycosyltransferase involved in cell wall biosynthesis/membrane protein DedA with SNARE-associated domain
MDSEILDWIVQYGYIFMFLIMLFEGPVITASGALGAALGYFNIYIVLTLSFFASFVPDLIYYSIGHWGGSPALDRYGKKFGVSPERRREMARFINENAGKSLFFVKTVPFLGPPGLAIIGALGVSMKQFLWWSILIDIATSLFFAVIGYYAGKGYETLLQFPQYASYGLAVAFLLFILVSYLYGKVAKRIAQKIGGSPADEGETTRPQNVSFSQSRGSSDTPRRPLRVLVANDTYPPQLNGAAVATQRLLRGLADRGHSVLVIAPNTGLTDEMQKEPISGRGAEATILRVRSFPVGPLHPQFRVTNWVGIEAKLERAIQDFQPDIIHIQNHFILGRACLKIARKHGIPIIGTNHFMPDNLFEFIPGPLQQSISKIMWGHFLKTYNQLDYVTAPSLAAQKMLWDVGLTAPTRVISNGIDLAKYRKAVPPDQIYQKYNIHREQPTFLCVGRLEKDKNVHLIIKATANAAEKAAIQTVIVGKGKDEAEFRDLAQKLGLEGTVIFTGAIPDEDLCFLYNIADVYIGAGSAELQGMAVMEAMATGLPVLAANAVALPELVRDGENGFLFSLNEVDLTDKMLKILSQESKWQSMGEKSLSYIQAHDMQETLAQLEALYNEAIGIARASANLQNEARQRA